MSSIPPPSRLPTSTYRLQFNKNFTFNQAKELVGFFYDLGISDLYASPIFMAVRGSVHGYDVTDLSKINPEIGTEQELEELAKALHEKQMGLILDVVPNHMYVADASNRWWYDLLESGSHSPFAHFFDINWRPTNQLLKDKVLLPYLGQQYGKVLENGELQIAFTESGFTVHYGGKSWPLNPLSWISILEPLAQNVKTHFDEDHPDRMELESVLSSLNHFPAFSEMEVEKSKEFHREKEVVKRRLTALIENNKEMKAGLDAALNTINGQKGDSKSFDKLEEILSKQMYRLCFWRVASEEINYRRFFDINELAAIRVEEPDVFAAVHQLVFKLVREGLVSGLRIDHVDGLYDPKKYLEELQKNCQSILEIDTPFYVLVEKILSLKEGLNDQWKAAGTTGYDFMNTLNHLFIKKENAAAFKNLYEGFIGTVAPLTDLVYEAKKFICIVSMSSEIHSLSAWLKTISEQHRWSQDFTLGNLRFALQEVIASFPVYRSYATDEPLEIPSNSSAFILSALKDARRRNWAISGAAFDFIESVLLFKDPEGLSDEQLRERRKFVMRFQQLTGAVMAKGVEDTVFYRFYPLVSINEVGQELNLFGITIENFHGQNLQRKERLSGSLLATSTHDTKRSEDIRARLHVLSEIPSEWEEVLERWREINRPLKKHSDEEIIPEANEEYLIYQELLGSWPIEQMDEKKFEIYLERILNHVKKILREAKVHSSWINPNEDYENAVQEYVKAILSRSDENQFLKDFLRFHARIAYPGLYNSLSQTLLKICSPGIPDFYQGTEKWHFRLVDPDNRFPVDYIYSQKALEEIKESKNRDRKQFVKELAEHLENGKLKIFLIATALNLRKSLPKLFEQGEYIPLAVEGELSNHLIAFAREHDKECLIVIAGRFFSSLCSRQEKPIGEQYWKETNLILKEKIPKGVYEDIFTGVAIPLMQKSMPVAKILVELPFTILKLKKGEE